MLKINDNYYRQASSLSSCFEHRLEHHLTICNARIVTDLPHLKMNCNLGVHPGEGPSKVALASVPDDALLAFISKIERIHAGEYLLIVNTGFLEIIRH